jgi:hypothetical protein
LVWRETVEAFGDGGGEHARMVSELDHPPLTCEKD